MNRLLTATTVCLTGLAVGSTATAGQSGPEVYAQRAAHLLAEPGPSSVAENVVLFMIDGLRWQEVFAGADPLLIETLADNPRVLEAARAEFWRDTPEERRETLLPFLWGVVAEQGLLAGNVWQGSEVDVLNGLNFSYPGYNEILSGYPDERIDSNAPSGE